MRMIDNDDNDQYILVIAHSINDLLLLDCLQQHDPWQREKEEDLHNSFVHYSKMDCRGDVKEDEKREREEREG